jgi:hypothetical protein
MYTVSYHRSTRRRVQFCCTIACSYAKHIEDEFQGSQSEQNTKNAEGAEPRSDSSGVGRGIHPQRPLDVGTDGGQARDDADAREDSVPAESPRMRVGRYFGAGQAGNGLTGPACVPASSGEPAR